MSPYTHPSLTPPPPPRVPPGPGLLPPGPCLTTPTHLLPPTCLSSIPPKSLYHPLRARPRPPVPLTEEDAAGAAGPVRLHEAAARRWERGGAGRAEPSRPAPLRPRLLAGGDQTKGPRSIIPHPAGGGGKRGGVLSARARSMEQLCEEGEYLVKCRIYSILFPCNKKGRVITPTGC